jgi:hydroxyacylglutathione hydrolase
MTNYRKIVVGELQTNCYLFWNTKKEAVIIDPGDEGTEIAQEINTLGLTPKIICLTHGHFDHLMGVAELQLIYKIPLFASNLDQFLTDRAAKTAEYYPKLK